jgi:hypothetical protein
MLTFEVGSRDPGVLHQVEVDVSFLLLAPGIFTPRKKPQITTD